MSLARTILFHYIFVALSPLTLLTILKCWQPRVFGDIFSSKRDLVSFKRDLSV